MTAKDVQGAISPSITVPHDRQRITATQDETDNIQKDVAIEPEWRSMELDSGKLKKYCLMLSKIRLTCKQVQRVSKTLVFILICISKELCF